jgi:choline dehydrogenase
LAGLQPLTFIVGLSPEYPQAVFDNGPRQEDGAGLYTHNIFPDGTHASTAQTYLALARRTDRLQLITNAQATAILFENGRAVGVRYLRDGREQDIRATREVMVCGGAFHSPHLLMLSRIGEAASLSALGLGVRKALPGMGKNLQDHLLQPIFYRSQQDLPVPEFIAEAGLFVRTRPGMQAASPNLQFHFGAGLPAFAPPGLGANFAFVPILVQPLSRGQVRLESANPLDLPLVEPNYLAKPEDVRTLVAGVQLARRLAKTRAMSVISAGEAVPGEAVEGADLEGFIRDHCSTVWHPAGNCAMGLNRMSVVDPQLRAHGIDGLRVADASVMPRITAGNTHAVTVMIGERAADFVLAAI